MEMSDDGLRQIVLRNFSVTEEAIARMKRMLVANFEEDADVQHLKRFAYTHQLIDKQAARLGFARPTSIDLDDGAQRKLEDCGTYLALLFSGVEAVGRLIGAGVLIPSSERLVSVGLHLEVKTPRYARGLSFRELPTPYFPEAVMRSLSTGNGFVLTDPDLYLESLLPYVLHTEIAEALRESVACFRSEQYMASIVMLAKASEGAWIELGVALIDAGRPGRQHTFAKIREDLVSSDVGFAKKLRQLIKHIETAAEEYKPVLKAAGASLDDLRVVCHWSEILRDSRNVVHYASQPALKHEYENVATMLLAGSKHLKTLCAVRAATKVAVSDDRNRRTETGDASDAQSGKTQLD